MRFCIKLRTSVMFILMVIFTGCITFIPPHIPVPADNSFSCTGEVIEKGNLVSVIERKHIFSKESALPQADIIVNGVVGQPFLVVTSSEHKAVKLKYQDDDTMWFLPSERRQFFWRGTVTIGAKQTDTNVDFYVYANENGSDKRFVLTNAALGGARLEAADPLDVFNSTTGNFPFLIGFVHLKNNSYRIFAVLDPDSESHSNPFIFFKEIFLYPKQKFQFMGNNDTVVTELENGKYSIYDTLPEADRESMKQALALLAAYRHSSNVLKNNNDSWELPAYHRYVYPQE